MARLVLTDASPLIGLSIVGGLPWLRELFGEVWMPAAVHDAVLGGPVPRGQAEIRAALKPGGGLRLWRRAVPLAELPDLDEGEAACIRIALAQPPDPCLLLIDERLGRSVASERGIRMAGTAAVIGQARQRGLIAAARPVFERLHESDFRIGAEVIRTVLARVGEL